MNATPSGAPAGRVVASIEARMGSSRLPGKMLADIHGQPAVARVVARLQACSRVDAVVLATTTDPGDDRLAAWAGEHGVAVYRGSADDVLARVVEAQRMMESDVVVEVTGDCVLFDPELVDMGVATFVENECDVVTNVCKAGYPLGMDVQVFTRRDLETVAATVDDPAVREHVSLYFYEHPERYRVIHLMPPARWFGPHLRFQVDYPDDLRFVEEIYRRLEPGLGATFGLEDIMALLREEPALAQINAHCVERAPR